MFTIKRSLTLSLAHVLTHSPSHSPTYSPTHPLTRPRTHSPTLSLAAKEQCSTYKFLFANIPGFEIGWNFKVKGVCACAEG